MLIQWSAIQRFAGCLIDPSCIANHSCVSNGRRRVLDIVNYACSTTNLQICVPGKKPLSCQFYKKVRSGEELPHESISYTTLVVPVAVIDAMYLFL